MKETKKNENFVLMSDSLIGRVDEADFSNQVENKSSNDAVLSGFMFRATYDKVVHVYPIIELVCLNTSSMQIDPAIKTLTFVADHVLVEELFKKQKTIESMSVCFGENEIVRLFDERVSSHDIKMIRIDNVSGKFITTIEC